MRVRAVFLDTVTLLAEPDDGDALHDPLDYDVEHYVRVLRETFGARLERAVAPEDFAALFADPGQLTLFTKGLESARPSLTLLPREPSSA